MTTVSVTVNLNALVLQAEVHDLVAGPHEQAIMLRRLCLKLLLVVLSPSAGEFAEEDAEEVLHAEGVDVHEHVRLSLARHVPLRPDESPHGIPILLDLVTGLGAVRGHALNVYLHPRARHMSL
eukprot:16434297-Heterocapsa_arctica.AAC.2